MFLLILFLLLVRATDIRTARHSRGTVKPGGYCAFKVERFLHIVQSRPRSYRENADVVLT